MSETTVANVPKSDESLWKSLVFKLKDYFVQGQETGSDVKVYIPPFNSQAIPAGNAVDDMITSFSVFRVGDNLLPPNSPLYVPGKDSYIERLEKYLNFVKVEPVNDPGAAQVLQNANDAQTKAGEEYLVIHAKATKFYGVVNGKPATPGPEFDLWCMANFPQLAQAKNHMDATAAAYYSTLLKVKGPVAVMVQKDRQNLAMARMMTGASGYNMPCSTDPAPTTEKLPLVNKTWRPLWNIDATYKGSVQTWINTSLDVKQPFTLSFDSENQASKDWSEAGYQSIDASVSRNWFFASARIFVNGQEQTETVDTSKSSDKITCVLSAQNVSVFNIGPDSSWDIETIEKDYPDLIDQAPKDLLSPMYRISSMLIGYKVSITITMGASLYSSVKDSFNKTVQAGGSFSIMGFQISGNVSDGTTTNFSSVNMSDKDFSITIPGSNNTYPVLLGALGRRVGRDF